MKLVYIAGPYRADTPWEVERNVRRAEEIAYRVAEHGAAPMCPHANSRYFNGLFGDNFWLEATMEMLKRCDAVVTVGGWERSAGASAEVREASFLGIPVFHPRWLGFAPFAKWLKENP